MRRNCGHFADENDENAVPLAVINPIQNVLGVGGTPNVLGEQISAPARTEPRSA